MAIATRSSRNMSHDDSGSNNKSDDNHEYDVVMPGFRFHPTEEELVDFYLRRKVEGKRFNVEIITFLHLYRYDPWELPAMAAIGGKEWFFYVPRDRKYRNGDRPNRVTTSGYWKATGVDRMIRTENFRSIGLKKTLVFYSGKAPKGIRTGWIMNEYRLPQHETERYQKEEISLCRVYKRSGVEDHLSLQSRVSSSRVITSSSLGKRSLPVPETIHIQTSSSSTDKFQTNFESHFHQHHQLQVDKNVTAVEGAADASASASSSSEEVITVPDLSKQNPFPVISSPGLLVSAPNSLEEDDQSILNKQPPPSSFVLPNYSSLFTTPSSSLDSNSLDDLQKLIHCQQSPLRLPLTLPQSSSPSTNIMSNPPPPQYYQDDSGPFTLTSPQPQQLALNMLLSSLPITFSDGLWDWNPIPDANRDQCTDPFK